LRDKLLCQLVAVTASYQCLDGAIFHAFSAVPQTTILSGRKILFCFADYFSLSPVSNLQRLAFLGQQKQRNVEKLTVLLERSL
jgi:hypothetical protein